MAIYQTGWTPIQEFDSGGTVSTNLTNAFNNIDTALVVVNDNEVRSKNNESRLNNIEPDVNQLLIDVAKLKSTQYEFSKLQSPISITSDTFQLINSVTLSASNQGVYEYKLSVRFTYSSTTSSAIFRYAIVRNNATPVWYEVWEEPKDTTNDMTMDIFFPIEEVGNESIEFILEARCEVNTETLNVEFADLIIDQKK